MELTSVCNSTEMAAVLLEIVPKLLWRIRPNLPLNAEESDAGPGWREVAELRATPGQMTLLRTLVEHERCTMQGLAERLAVAPSTVTAMVKRLLAQGYIERSRGDTDWRTVWVTPTSSGRLAVSVYQQARLARLKRFLEQLSDDERASIQAALPALLHLVEVQA
jgi:DNA-binding MarR family transcriptional regulator